ncbi:dihydrofolate reductase [Chryseobacterium sp.]|nr:dihydrofolate reductase [Chryseobacterium sp.]
MRKVIVAINMTLDGYCDHTAISPDEEIHQHYSQLLRNAGVILYGRITYELMQYWQMLLINPSGNPSMDEFAVAMDQIPKLVFSHELTDTGWASAQIADRPLGETVKELKRQPGKDIFIGSRSLMSQLAELRLIDEYQICVHPLIAGNGLLLFENIRTRTALTLIRTQTFTSGAVILSYKPADETV